jgi:hypothetical protein
MPERKHNLPTMFSRLDDQITGDVLDASVIHRRSHGRLYMDGEWSTDNRPPGHQVKRSSSDPDNQGVDYEERLVGGPERYTVTYDVWNHRDSPSFARIILTGQTEQAREDTPGVKRNEMCLPGWATAPKTPRARG